jgi:hypothetical protein
MNGNGRFPGEDAGLIQVSAGFEHTCGIQAGDFTINCWGTVTGMIPEGSFQEVSAGIDHTCAIGDISDMGVSDMGSDVGGSDMGVSDMGSDVGVSDMGVSDMGVSDMGSDVGVSDMGVSDMGDDGAKGYLRCWGQGKGADDLEPSGVLVKQVSTSGYHACAVDAQNKYFCWGDNTNQAVTPSSDANTNVAMLTELENLAVRQIGVGRYYSCALTHEENSDTGKIVCWGRRADLENPPKSYNELDAPDGLFVSIGIGYYHGCAIDSEQKLSCWGWGGNGCKWEDCTTDDECKMHCPMENDDAAQCVEGKCTDVDGKPMHDVPDGQFTQVSAGYDYTCALDMDGKVHCWGLNVEGQLNSP